jgi:hypothetical protein
LSSFDFDRGWTRVVVESQPPLGAWIVGSHCGLSQWALTVGSHISSPIQHQAAKRPGPISSIDAGPLAALLTQRQPRGQPVPGPSQRGFWRRRQRWPRGSPAGLGGRRGGSSRSTSWTQPSCLLTCGGLRTLGLLSPWLRGRALSSRGLRLLHGTCSAPQALDCCTGRSMGSANAIPAPEGCAALPPEPRPHGSPEGSACSGARVDAGRCRLLSPPLLPVQGTRPCCRPVELLALLGLLVADVGVSWEWVQRGFGAGGMQP